MGRGTTNIYDENHKRIGHRPKASIWKVKLAVVTHADMTQETCTALAHLNRDESWWLKNYKP